MTQTMQAAVFDHYGDVDVLHIADIPRPTISAGQILVKVHAAAINPKDTFIRKGRFKRFTGNDFPKTTGFDFAGVVAESQVDDLPLGTPVFGMLDGWHGATCAEYVVVAGEQVAIKPDNVSFVDAAAIPLVGLTALQALRDEGGLRENANQSVCINGASGGVGTMAVQIAKRYGAKVTAIASERNHAFLRELGADHCIDYRQTDITQTNSQFDIFFDVFGNINYRNAKPILTPSGTWVSTVLKLHVFVSMMLSRFTRQSAKLVVVKANRADLQQLGEWLAIGA
ncbi:MAG: NAD(P)-dependent alcohol dehydrogenase, partial [Chloroflexota bacterium]